MGLLQDKNAIYLFTAYGVFLGGLAVYLIALWLRRRNLDRDEEIVRQIEEEERQHPSPVMRDGTSANRAGQESRGEREEADQLSRP